MMVSILPKQCKRCGGPGPFGITHIKGVPFERNVCTPCGYKTARYGKLTKLERILFVPDCHIPYHDEQAFALMLKAAEAFRPQILVVLGDFADFYSVSAHDKTAGRASQLASELQVVNEKLTLLDGLGAARKIFVRGNHEDRLDRYLMRQASALVGLVDVSTALKLKERGYEDVPYKGHIRLGSLLVTHDTERAGRYSVFQSKQDVAGSVVIGHTHRIGYVVEGDIDGKPRLAASFGWLGDFTKVDYMHRIRAQRDWSHGFGLGYLAPDGTVHVTSVPIIDGSCLVEGKLIRLG